MAEEENAEEEVKTEESEEVKGPVPRFDPEALGQVIPGNAEDDAIYVDDMYGDWFLDYASYVILERCPPCG